MATKTCSSCGQTVNTDSSGKARPHQSGGSGTGTCPGSNK